MIQSLGYEDKRLTDKIKDERKKRTFMFPDLIEIPKELKLEKIKPKEGVVLKAIKIGLKKLWSPKRRKKNSSNPQS